MPDPMQAGEPMAAVGQAAAWWNLLPVALIVSDGTGRITQWAKAAPELLGYAAREVIGRHLTDLALPDHRPEARAVHEAVASGRSVTGHFPMRRKNGSTIGMEVWGCPVAAQGGEGWDVLLLAADAREARQAREVGGLLDALFARSPMGLAVFDTELRFQQVNRALEAMNGLPAAAHIGHRPSEVLPGVNSEQMEAAMRRVLVTGDPVVNFRRIGRTPSDPDHERVWSCSYFRLEDADGEPLGINASIIDVTAEEKNEREAAAGRQRLALLNEATLRVGTTLDAARTGQELADIAVPRLADIVTVDVLADLTEVTEPMTSLWGGATLRRLGKAPARGHPAADILTPVGSTLHFPVNAPYAQAVIDRRPFLLRRIDARAVAQAARYSSIPERLRSLGVTSMMMVPLTARGLVLGVATFLRDGDRPAFDAADLALVGDLAAHAAVCIDNARLYHREHDVALTLKRSMLPSLPKPPAGIEVAHRYRPASDVHEVGGDWFDVATLAPGKGALVIGDVMGHGIQAAAIMGQMRTTVRAFTHLDLPPDQLLHHLDDALQELDSPLLATCLYGICDCTAGRCRLGRAGHPPPALVTPDGTARLLDLPAGAPLGIGGISFATTEIVLDPGSIIVFYTDGLIETRGADLDERLDELVRLLTGAHNDLDQLCDTLMDRFAPTPAEDDITILAARITTPTA
ncbi:SpoIIE family protein phosphatase [Streptomyces sp. CoH27]|uniref:SpoIIE family protein phosphatase n=1 Tax=Streptomyces sp. CoH27 TaxID=2875763 RepID=UPI001CD2A29A|nr:SpoIIE family protein phosphatase [Streptomyces sp. CoH27]